ncbi:MAG: energy-coupling factor ABC transporter ATP-binding protein [Clostridiales bacterium]|jgi:energy-coupling factor transport system ATP-binding protein|nr:energy-coupling factor ABC transporter ATP-binding protein [Clostridiales bacterium]
MISVSRLHFSYDGKSEVLSDINIDIDQRSTAIIGQNGAGKTTFIKILKGLLKPGSGKVTILGEDTAKRSAAQWAGVIGMVFQNPNDQIFKKTVLEETLFGPLNIKMMPKAARENAMEALSAVGLADKTDSNPYDLNLSDKKLLCIASVLAMNTRVVIFDEPTIAQDWQGMERIKNIIKALKVQGKLVMTVVHDMDFVAECFERVIVFNEGKVLLDGSTDYVFTQTDILRRACVSPPHIVQLGALAGLRRVCLTEDEFVLAYREKRCEELGVS